MISREEFTEAKKGFMADVQLPPEDLTEEELKFIFHTLCTKDFKKCMRFLFQQSRNVGIQMLGVNLGTEEGKMAAVRMQGEARGAVLALESLWNTVEFYVDKENEDE